MGHIKRIDCYLLLYKLTSTVTIFMKTQMSYSPLKAWQHFAEVIVPWFIRPMSCVVEATAGGLLTAPGCPSKELRVSRNDTANKMLPLLSSASSIREQQPEENTQDLITKLAREGIIYCNVKLEMLERRSQNSWSEASPCSWKCIVYCMASTACHFNSREFALQCVYFATESPFIFSKLTFVSETLILYHIWCMVTHCILDFHF